MTPAVYSGDIYSDDAIRDPLPIYAELRKLGAVVYLPRHDVYALPRYTEVASVLRQPKLFINSKGVSLSDKVNKLLAGSTLNSDPPEHDQTRAVTSAPLLPGALKGIEPRIRNAADGLIETLCERGRFDAIRDLAQYLPVTIVSELVGLPTEGRAKMLTWASATFNLFGPENERANAAFDELRDLKAFLDHYGTPEKLNPGGWAHRIFAVGAERGISYETCAQLMRDYINPSLDTTISATGQAIKFFTDHPDQWDLVRQRPELIPNAIEEVVRLATPIRAFTRYVATDTEIAGTPIPEGSRVLVMFASANRDERKFNDPDRFDVTRDVHDHLGFGSGVHMCMGMHLARLEMVALLEALAKRVSRFVADGEPTIAMNNTIRAYASLPTRVEVTEYAPTAPAPVANQLDTALTVRVAARLTQAIDVISLDLVSADGRDLPAYEAGSHIDVRAPGGVLRQYSLTGDPRDKSRYRIGVLLEPNSRGGSASMHKSVVPGTALEIGRPRNHFHLVGGDARHSVLFAGGIGITPILAMAYALDAKGESFELHYCGRSSDRFAFKQELATFGDRVCFHADDGTPQQRLDINAVLSNTGPDRHLYICGPNGFMDFVTEKARQLSWGEDAIHLERFGAEVDTDGAPFTVIAQKSGIEIEVLPGETITDRLVERGVHIPMSCQSGVCGTCITTVISGTPDHRDLVLTDTEKANNDRMTICCSRSKSRVLVLDI